ncbi:MAG: rod shape-determining protein MreD [Lachnospiraceae bacterium]|nr:rod shape-determining protein MreD [Lachnospiraceae bacterium]
MKRKILELILIIITFVLQCTLYRVIALGGIVPNLLILLTSSFGFIRGRREGMFVGFFAGLFTDLLFGNGVLGLYMLIYIWIGYLNGLFSRLFYPDDLKYPVLLIGISDLIFGFVSYVLTFLLRSRLSFTYYFTRIMLPELVYTIVATLLLYRFILSFETALSDREEVSEEE